jgi:biopolymer transport protein TolR
MGMTVQGNGGAGGRTTPTTLAEINVTPLVDVMLVLLIVFMISAPLMQQGMTVDLPRANIGSLNEVPDQIKLVIDKAHMVHINDHEIPVGTLQARLAAIVAVKPNVEVYVQADQVVPYGVVAQVMAEAKKAKINRVGLVTLPEEYK